MRAIILTAMLIGCGPAMARSLPEPSITAYFLICIGDGACSEATDERCAVALGHDVQFPPHAWHVMVTKDGVRPLDHLDSSVVAQIDAAIDATTGEDGHRLSQTYVNRWNRECAVPVS